MKPVDRRKLFAALRRSAKSRGIKMIEDADAGSGSHGSVLFSDGSGCKPLRLVLVYSRDVTPGVQRAITAYLAQRAASAPDGRDRALAAAVSASFKESLH